MNLNQMTVSELKQLAASLNIPLKGRVLKKELIEQIQALQQATDSADQKEAEPIETKRTSREKESRRLGRYKLNDNIEEAVVYEGAVRVLPEGYGIIDRQNELGIYVSASQIQKFRIETGDVLGGRVRAPKPGEKYAAMLFLDRVNGKRTADLIKKMEKLMASNAVADEARYQKSQSGILDITADGYGFLRTKDFLPGEQDIYVAANVIRRYQLRTGDKIEGHVRKSGENDRYDALLYVEKVNGDLPETVTHRPHFVRLTPIFPNERINLETPVESMAARIIDLFAPIGRGQRGLIVAPPKAGKTTLLKIIANGIRTNAPEMELIVLLVDERPEEVTDMQRSVDADIVSSTFDEPVMKHLQAAEMVLARGQRLVEQGKNVVILVDSLTRLARSNNLVIEPSGRTLTGGLDPESLYFPKKFFGAARNIENGGSLTILATALIDTGSRMDDIIYEEFKGTGNMELTLSRDLAERHIFPAIDIRRSGTRRDDLLLSRQEEQIAVQLRKAYAKDSVVTFAEKMTTLLEHTPNNAALIQRFNRE
ncbi:transcription termination factor Rho [Pseudoramibacter alactolyticus ATCC 23263]|uniref:Transcription termination factor Rho n=1 Tax=Pseudoramibacter alactolyticus ATCC 23263 TaxID=887929 RepID=E6MEV0_9FIRM|nr:transcription termination factor Rho [Pseudoramibacter alactolyticus ATCC 23263]